MAPIRGHFCLSHPFAIFRWLSLFRPFGSVHWRTGCSSPPGISRVSARRCQAVMETLRAGLLILFAPKIVPVVLGQLGAAGMRVRRFGGGALWDLGSGALLYEFFFESGIFGFEGQDQADAGDVEPLRE